MSLHLRSHRERLRDAKLVSKICSRVSIAAARDSSIASALASAVRYLSTSHRSKIHHVKTNHIGISQASMVACRVKSSKSKYRSSSASKRRKTTTKNHPKSEITPYELLRRIRKHMIDKHITPGDIRMYMKIDARFQMVDFYHIHRAIRFLGVDVDEKQSRKLFRLFYTGSRDTLSKREYISSDVAMSIFFENLPNTFYNSPSREKKPWKMFEEGSSS